MRTLPVLALALVCVFCGVAADPYPCPDFRTCIQMIEQLNEQLSLCERRIQAPVRPGNRDCGIAWGRLFAEVGLITVCVVAASVIVGHVKLKMREQKRYTSMPAPSDGLLTSLGIFGRTTAQWLRDGQGGSLQLPPGRSLVRGHLKTAAVPNADTASAIPTIIHEADAVIAIPRNEDGVYESVAPSGDTTPSAGFRAHI
ncbi:hypothetical protein AAVH_09685 [Aphelenchoides avenae]|nr:hypothetical protein AAVH_09685 [Aphelenchus avenae]